MSIYNSTVFVVRKEKEKKVMCTEQLSNGLIGRYGRLFDVIRSEDGSSVSIEITTILTEKKHDLQEILQTIIDIAARYDCVVHGNMYCSENMCKLADMKIACVDGDSAVLYTSTSGPETAIRKRHKTRALKKKLDELAHLAEAHAKLQKDFALANDANSRLNLKIDTLNQEINDLRKNQRINIGE